MSPTFDYSADHQRSVFDSAYARFDQEYRTRRDTQGTPEYNEWVESRKMEFALATLRKPIINHDPGDESAR